MSERYMDAVLAGTALWTDADDYVERWHNGRSVEPLHEYLGLSWEEYALWTERPETLRLIITAHELRQPVSDVLERTDEYAVAARGLSISDADAVRRWLMETGRLPS